MLWGEPHHAKKRPEKEKEAEKEEEEEIGDTSQKRKGRNMDIEEEEDGENVLLDSEQLVLIALGMYDEYTYTNIYIEPYLHT